MKLEKFKEKNQKRTKIIVFTILCILLVVGVFFYSSFALFEVKENFNILKGDIESPGDLSFVYYVDDVVTKNPPTMSSGYTLSSKSSCNNGVTVTWDNENWSALVNYTNYQKTNTSVVKCSLYFEKFSKIITECGKEKSGATCLLENKSKTNELVLDETIDNNLRYIGANPNNYVSFNNELWRIIGVMNNMKTNETDSGESRIKLVREESIGNYSWDASETSINLGKGINEWSQSTLKKLLNEGEYWNKTAGICIVGDNNKSQNCDFTQTGLTEESKQKLEYSIWFLGSNGNEKLETVKVNELYTLEKSSNTGKICSSGTSCNDNITRTHTWTGAVGLISLTDYFYATKKEELCFSSAGYSLKEDAYLSCRNNNWMFKNDHLWTINPRAHSGSSYLTLCINQLGGLDNCTSSIARNVYPSVYLKANVKIISGCGEKENPYILE